MFLVVVAARGHAGHGALVAVVLFGALEALTDVHQLWVVPAAAGVTRLGGLALYVLPAEAALGAAAVMAVRTATQARVTGWAQLGLAVVVSVGYTGALAVCWLLDTLVTGRFS